MNMNRKIVVLLITLIAAPMPAALAQHQFTLQDTLRGSITPERAWWDLTYYHLDIRVDPAEKSIEGFNTVQYRVLGPGNRVQIDLQPPMELTLAEQDGKSLDFERLGNVYYIDVPDQTPGAVNELRLAYSGKPRVAANPPWDGGLTWTTDANGKPFVATSVQGEGASIWWPCKDHMYDEPDSMLISVRVPDSLSNVSNGRLRGIEKHDDGTHTSHWFVANPINNYGVNINIGDYAHWSDVYDGEKGRLDLDFYVLRDNVAPARKQFRQAQSTLQAFEHWFGPYPFYEDGFKLVEVPYLGMEHQSSVTYGNGYRNGYRGMDLSGTGWGLEWDYIIIHESGHEWFANNITYKDIADMWIHEAFTTYSENLYIDYHFGKKAASEYVIGQRRGIRNTSPIIGPYGVNQAGSGDMYSKGANILHTIRTIIDDDELWRSILRGLNEEFYHQTVTTEQIEQYMIDKSGIDLRSVFDQYLRDHRIPVLELSWADVDAEAATMATPGIQVIALRYRWVEVNDGFDMPVEIKVGDEVHSLTPTTDWQSIPADRESDIEIDPDYYVDFPRRLAVERDTESAWAFR